MKRKCGKYMPSFGPTVELYGGSSQCADLVVVGCTQVCCQRALAAHDGDGAGACWGGLIHQIPRLQSSDEHSVACVRHGGRESCDAGMRGTTSSLPVLVGNLIGLCWTAGNQIRPDFGFQLAATHADAVSRGEVPHDLPVLVAADAAEVGSRAGRAQHPLRHPDAVLRRASGDVLHVRLRRQLLHQDASLWDTAHYPGAQLSSADVYAALHAPCQLQSKLTVRLA